ncbi:hypothetical protein BBJ29_003416 [Phytophthora kernoviae]|uniref:Uncharacterized protein n=1 Tax=Phytophthora kernoviae TaxID=325452 RepID=A0A3F2RRQ4_9STRA|nr:hypothetical protein BBP00_00005087 [Phytophthora kernoviae]RLN64091.1 hypothetical protein BBJ29_003416 [Phytophthora kernoviae]
MTESSAKRGYASVKMKLETFCTDAELALPWEEVLKDMNKMAAEAYTLANLHAIRSCDPGFEFPPLNRSFFQQCLAVVSGGDLNHRRTTITQDFRDSVAIYNS